MLFHFQFATIVDIIDNKVEPLDTQTSFVLLFVLSSLLGAKKNNNYNF
jgi:hypothetical protein